MSRGKHQRIIWIFVRHCNGIDGKRRLTPVYHALGNNRRAPAKPSRLKSNPLVLSPAGDLQFLQVDLRRHIREFHSEPFSIPRLHHHHTLKLQGAIGSGTNPWGIVNLRLTHIVPQHHAIVGQIDTLVTHMPSRQRTILGITRINKGAGLIRHPRTGRTGENHHSIRRQRIDQPIPAWMWFQETARPTGTPHAKIGIKDHRALALRPHPHGDAFVRAALRCCDVPGNKWAKLGFRIAIIHPIRIGLARWIVCRPSTAHGIIDLGFGP